MKRHPGLRDLSSDHHQGLVHSRRLTKAADTPTADNLKQTAGDFLIFWAQHTSPHFREEEEVLLPAFSAYGDPSHPAIARMLVEHVHIRRMVGDLQQQVERGQPSADTMRSIGEMLRVHIRHEEDVVFPLIEVAMPESALASLPALFASFAPPPTQA